MTESPIPGDYRIHSAPSTRFRRTSHARAGKLEGGKAFVLCVRGGVDCFQCLLRSGPAAATVAPQCRIGCRLPQDHRLQGLKPDEPLASISGRDVGVPSIVFTKIGNRSLTPFPCRPADLPTCRPADLPTCRPAYLIPAAAQTFPPPSIPRSWMSRQAFPLGHTSPPNAKQFSERLLQYYCWV